MVSEDEARIGRLLHARLLVGDPLAKNDTCQHFLAPISQRLQAKYRTTDADVVHDAVVDALLDYVERPEQYDPTRRSLLGFLLMAAERDLQNARPRHVRRQQHESGGDPVELETSGGNIEIARGRDVGDEMADEDAATRLRAEAMAVMADDQERTVLRLMLDGVRETAAYARELGWLNLTPSAQREQVNRLKDRVTKRLRRRLPRNSDG